MLRWSPVRAGCAGAEQNCHTLTVLSHTNHHCHTPPRFATTDCAYLFSYSIIMLNTDLHNANIREDRKMSLKSFIKQNKYYSEEFNRGRELPEELLRSVYNEIKARRIVPPLDSLGSAAAAELGADLWRDLMQQQASSPDPHLTLASGIPALATRALDGYVLQDLWEPAMHAFTVAFARCVDHRDAEAVLESVAQLAAVAVSHNMQGALNYIVATLSRCSGLLNSAGAPGDGSAASGGGGGGGGSAASKEHGAAVRALGAHAATWHGEAPSASVAALYAFGSNVLAQMAVVAAFELCRTFGDQLGAAGWRWILYLTLRLYVVPLPCCVSVDVVGFDTS